jgi:hypothetical protein
VPEHTVFCPQTRKEVSKVSFHSIDNLQNIRHYGIYPFLPKLKRWISIAKRNRSSVKSGTPIRDNTSAKRRASISDNNISNNNYDNRSSNNNRTASRGRQQNGNGTATFDTRNKDTFSDEISTGTKGWDVNSMFAANAKLTGKEYNYDGNPHAFGSTHPRFINYRDGDSSNTISLVVLMIKV